MTRRFLLAIGLVLLAAFLAPLSAAASFGLSHFDVVFEEEDGSSSLLAGSHPFAMTTSFAFNTIEKGGILVPDESAKDVIVDTPSGFVGDLTAVPTCSGAEFIKIDKAVDLPQCSDATALGYISLELSVGDSYSFKTTPVYNLVPSAGEVNKFGFVVLGNPVTVDVGLSHSYPYQPIARSEGITQQLNFDAARLILWGYPADQVHDPYRGSCLSTFTTPHFGERVSLGECAAAAAKRPFLTLPRTCRGPLLTSYEADSWQHPGVFIGGSDETEGDAFGCENLAFNPTVAAQPTTKAATSPTGLDFSLDATDKGLQNPTGVAHADIEKAVVTLPEGFTTNPAVAEGLTTCSEADLERETVSSAPGEGCPPASKIGAVEVESPLIDESVDGSLYVATPYENPFESLLALYIVIKNPTLGIIVKQPLKVGFNPTTGQITTTAEEIPPLPFSHFKLHFREGAHSPLASPPGCGSYDAKAVLTPSSGEAPLTTTSAFQIISGPDGAPCPSGGLPPFRPNLVAGTENNAAGAFSPFLLKLTRTDSEQEFTHFSIKLPRGVAGKLAGIPFCSDAQIAAAQARTGPHGGAEELAAPSCPAASQVGRTLAGAGVGPSLAYAPGKIYLAGPYHGSPISFVSITAGVVGPFDIGTVVVRLAIRVDPETGEVFLDSVGSDPIPHIIKGIPVHLRDIRAYADRPEFTFNPTSCERKSTAATVLGSGLDFASEADDNPFVSTSPFQAADCAALPFEPKLTLKLLGGTKRGDFPKLTAYLKMNGLGEAGISRAQVTLPRSEFIANAHFNTICTRAQFKQAGGNGEACPAGSVYGWARAKTPILSDPLEGPVYLRSSEHKLPDVVASLRAQEINVHLVGHVDSVKGQLRNTFEAVPDAPVEWASFSFEGGKKGLFENSTNLCAKKNHADVRFTGQNGKAHNYKPVLKVKCRGKAKKRMKAKR